MSEYEFRISPLGYAAVNKYDDFAGLIDSIVIIKPETTDLSFLSPIKKLITTPQGEFIIMDKNGVYHFSRTGSFIRVYGKQGRALNEYISLTDIALNNSSGALFILDAMNRVLIFDISKGEFQRAITPDWQEKTISLDGIIPLSDGRFYIFSANPTYMRSDSDYYGLYEFDSDGRKTGEYLLCHDFIIGLGSLSQNYESRFLIKPLTSDNIVHEVSDRGIVPVYWIDFGDKNAPSGTIYNDKGEQDLKHFFASDYYKNPSYFQQTDSYVSFIYAGPKYESAGIIYSKSSDMGIIFQAPDKRTIPFTFIASDKDFMYGIMNKYSEEDMEHRADPLTRYLIDTTGLVDLEENPRIIGIKFKF